MEGTLGLKKGSVPFKNDLETTLDLHTMCQHVCDQHLYTLILYVELAQN